MENPIRNEETLWKSNYHSTWHYLLWTGHTTNVKLVGRYDAPSPKDSRKLPVSGHGNLLQLLWMDRRNLHNIDVIMNRCNLIYSNLSCMCHLKMSFGEMSCHRLWNGSPNGKCVENPRSENVFCREQGTRNMCHVSSKHHELDQVLQAISKHLLQKITPRHAHRHIEIHGIQR